MNVVEQREREREREKARLIEHFPKREANKREMRMKGAVSAKETKHEKT